jgi:hypothetical protein
MSSVAVHSHLSTIIDAVAAGDRQTLARTARAALARAEDASELIGQVGLLAMRGDSEGHTVLMLGAAGMLCRKLIALRHVLGEDAQEQANGVSLATQVLAAATPAVQAGKDAPRTYPKAIFPSDLSANETVAARMRQAVYEHDALTVERLLFGLYGTGADYRAMQVRIYDAISQTFQEDGHSLLYAVRGAQVLDAVEWGEDAPNYIHWLAPHLPLHTEEPSWIDAVRGFLQEPQHSLESYRTRLAAPKNENALPLRSLILSDAPTPKVCQGVYDALIKNGASSRGVGSVIALAACDLLQNISDEDFDLFVRASHGLLYASATRLVYTQVQEVEALPLLFTAAAAINALYKELGAQSAPPKSAHPGVSGGGLIAPALLESLSGQIEAQDVNGALATARRYIQLAHDPHALIAVIGLGAAQADSAADLGHALQIVLAAGDEYLAWPKDLTGTNVEGFLRIAIRAAAQARRNTTIKP